MYLYTDGRAETDLASGYDNTIHWCLKTHKGFGPDDDLVTRLDCRDTSRPCYEPL
jgi:hypothetical protein